MVRMLGLALPLVPVVVLLPPPAGADGSLYGRIRNPLPLPAAPPPQEAMALDGPWNLRLRALPQSMEAAAGWLPQSDPSSDVFGLALDWGALSAGAGYSDLQGDGLDARDPWRLNASYRWQRFGLSGQYEQNEPADGATFSEWSLLGEYHLGNSTLRAMFSDQQEQDRQQRSWALGLQHAFSERTRIYSEFQDGDQDDDSRIGVGLRYDF